MKDIKLFVAEMTFRDGVRLNGAQKEQLVPILEHFAKEVYSEGYDNALIDVLTWDDNTLKEKMQSFKKDKGL